MGRPLRDRFLSELSGRTSFTFSEAKQWYTACKTGSKPAYGSNVYTTLINPLLAEGLIVKGMRGLYILTGTTALEPAEAKAPKELDEFDAYLKEKGIR